MHMNYKVISKITGLLTFILGVAMLLCAAVAYAYSEPLSGKSFLVIGGICAAAGLALFRLFRNARTRLNMREGYFIAFMSWIYCSFIGALAFYFSGQDYSFAGSFFETVSGFTTTGATVFSFEDMPKALILWRAMSSWIGGMGIIVLVVSLFPAAGISSQSIVPLEATSSVEERIGLKFKDTGKYLYLIYFSMTLAEFVLLLFSPLSFFDVVTNTLSSVSTGSLFETSANTEIFRGTYVRFVILFFTGLSSLNFMMIYLFIRGKRSLVLKNRELRSYIGIILISTGVVAASLRISGAYDSLWQAVKDGLCQVVAFASTSGYYVTDYSSWPTTALMVLVTLIFVGGCTMSTSGGIKVTRFIIFCKMIKRGIFLQIHPNAVKSINIGDKAVDARKVSSTAIYILLLMVTLGISCIIVSLDGRDMETTISAVISLFSNTGCALGEVGPTADYSVFSQPMQLFMSLIMIAGRLELYAVILLFTGSFWRLDRVRTL